jgi:anti-sigma factor RsiW
METDDLLSARLPHFQAPPRLKECLQASFSPTLARVPGRPTSRKPIGRWLVPVVSAALSAVIVWGVLRAPGRGEDDTLWSEAVSDHLRVISSSHPVEIESGGIHQVKPWFTGRLDFAPRISFSGDDDFPLVGGSVGYFLDRKAAVLVFKCRLHTITLLVFPNERLPWPASSSVRFGTTDGIAREWRGFNVLAWKRADLGFALVSDVNRADLVKLATRIAEP